MPASQFEALVEAPRAPGTTILAKIYSPPPSADEKIPPITGDELSEIFRKQRCSDIAQEILRIEAKIGKITPRELAVFIRESDRRGFEPKINLALNFLVKLANELSQEKKPSVHLVK